MDYIITFSSIESKLNSQVNTEKIVLLYLYPLTHIGLSQSGKVFSISECLTAPFQRIDLHFHVSQIACNKFATLFLTSEGQVFSQGTDPEQYGFLGNNIFASEQPELIPGLSEITQISIGKTHAGALNEQGNFFMWGKCSSLNSSSVPVKHGFDLFTIQEFECGLDYTLITTHGGYIYLVGKLGYTHSSTDNSNIGGVLSPPDIERMCIACSRAAYRFVAVLNDEGDVFVFDGCLETVKLPLPSYHKVRYIYCFGKSILGICENNYVIQWKIGVKQHNDCRMYSYWGTGFNAGNFEVIGKGSKMVIVKSNTDNPIKEKRDSLMPYKRTEFGKKLIEKARKSVKINGKIDALKGSFDNSPIFKGLRNIELQKCEKLVYAVNLLVRNIFSDIKISCKRMDQCKMFKNNGIGGIFYTVTKKYERKLINKGFDKFIENVVLVKMKEFLRKNAIETLEKVIYKSKAFFVLASIKSYVFSKTMHKALLSIEKVVKKHKLGFVKQLKVNAKLEKFCKVMTTSINHVVKSRFLVIEQNYHQTKSCEQIYSVMLSLCKSRMLSHFISIKSYASVFLMHENVYKVHKAAHLSILAVLLKKLAFSKLRPSFIILRHLYSLLPLKRLVQTRLTTLLSKLKYHIISPSILKLQSALTNSCLRSKAEYFTILFYMIFCPHILLEKLSPIKAHDDYDLSSPRTYFNTLSLPFFPQIPKHKTSNSDNLSEFKKYLLWRKEFGPQIVAEKNREKDEKKPPWRPAGTITKVKSHGEMKKFNARIREYSESIRSSRSSYSSEESFCKKIGWDKNEYLRRIKDRKSFDLLRLVAGKFIGRIVSKGVKRIWKDFKEKIKKRPSHTVKTLVKSNWKFGLFNIGFAKFANALKKIVFKRILSYKANKKR